jgi:hypothetical protein
MNAHERCGVSIVSSSSTAIYIAYYPETGNAKLQNAFFTRTQVIVLLIAVAFQFYVTLKLQS